MSTTTCARCRAVLPTGAPFCTSCGARADGFGLATPAGQGMPVCSGCGVLVTRSHSACTLCGTELSRAVRAQEDPDGGYWVRALVHFQCRSCGQRSPLNSLDLDGAVACARCGLTQAFDLDAFSEALEHAHGVGDLAWPPPFGRHHDANGPEPTGHPFVAVGDTRATYTFEATGIVTRGGVMRTRSLFFEVGPGHPLCETCKAPLGARLEGSTLIVACERCNTRERYAVPPAAEPVRALPAGLYADDACLDRADARMDASAGGAVAIRCPTCNAVLEAEPEQHFVQCRYCRTPCRIPSKTLWMLHTDKVAAKPFWLYYRGPSTLRQKVVRGLLDAAEAARRESARRHAASLEEQRRAESTLPLTDPPAPEHTRVNLLGRMGFAVGLTLLVGLGFHESLVTLFATPSTKPPRLAAPTVAASDAPELAAPPVAGPPEVPYDVLPGCGCTASEIGAASGVELGLRRGQSFESSTEAIFNVEYAFVHEDGSSLPIVTGPGTPPPTVIRSHALQLVLGCDDGRVIVADGRGVASFDPMTGSRLGLGMATLPIQGGAAPPSGLAVTCIRARVADGALVVGDGRGARVRIP